MSSITLAFSSSTVKPLAELRARARGVIVDVHASDGRGDRLLSLGVTPGAAVTVLQTFPGVVFLCDQTELAIERAVARSIYVRLEQSSVASHKSAVSRQSSVASRRRTDSARDSVTRDSTEDLRLATDD